jgi:hypothetical protein
MLIDIQAPPSDENISRRKSDHEILYYSVDIYSQISHRFQVNCVTFTGSTETPLVEKTIYIRETESNFLIVVCFHFPHLSLLRVIRVNSIRQLRRRPLALKIFSVVNPTPTSNWWSVDIFAYLLPLFELFAYIQFSS